MYSVIELQIPARSSHIPATLTLPQSVGSCPLVALVHGFGGTRQEGGGYIRIAESLAAHGIASVRMDFPGCGDSTESFRLCTLSNMVGDVETCMAAALSAYPLDAERLGVLGMSLGGRVTMELINRRTIPLPAAVLIAPAADNETICQVIGGWERWNALYAAAKRDGFAPIPDYFGGPDLELSPAWFSDFLNMDTLEGAKPGPCAVRVIYAEDDAIVVPALSKRCALAYDAKLSEIGGDGHSYGCYSERTDVLQRVIDCVVRHFQSA